MDAKRTRSSLSLSYRPVTPERRAALERGPGACRWVMAVAAVAALGVMLSRQASQHGQPARIRAGWPDDCDHDYEDDCSYGR